MVSFWCNHGTDPYIHCPLMLSHSPTLATSGMDQLVMDYTSTHQSLVASPQILALSSHHVWDQHWVAGYHHNYKVQRGRYKQHKVLCNHLQTYMCKCTPTHMHKSQKRQLCETQLFSLPNKPALGCLCTRAEINSSKLRSVSPHSDDTSSLYSSVTMDTNMLYFQEHSGCTSVVMENAIDVFAMVFLYNYTEKTSSRTKNFGPNNLVPSI